MTCNRRRRARSAHGLRFSPAAAPHLADELDTLWHSACGAQFRRGLQCLAVSRDAATRADLLLVCSTGGHLLQLVALRESWQQLLARLGDVRQERRPVAARGRARLLRARADEPEHQEHAPQPRRRLALIGELRPKVVLTTGAGVAVPFAWIARLRGATVVYVESLARIEGPSLTYRLIAPIAKRRYVQWPELAAALHGARYAGNVFSADA